MALNVTVLNQILVEENGVSHIPSQYYIMLVIIAFVFFILSLYFDKSNDISAIIAAITFAVVAWLTPQVEWLTFGFVSTNLGTTDYVYAVSQAYHPQVTYIAYFFVMFFLIAVVNVIRIWMINLKLAGENKLYAQQQEEIDFRRGHNERMH
jgi:hypothetical protein